MKRRTVLTAMAATSLVPVVSACSSSSSSSSSTSAATASLDFDATAHQEITATIADADGTDHQVVYHFWKSTPYVAKPVDDTHQTLTVSVPVSIDGKSIDASSAPIVFCNAVGGYFPATVATSTGVGGSTMEMSFGSAGGSAASSTAGASAAGGTGGGPGGGAMPSAGASGMPAMTGMPQMSGGTGATGGTGANSASANAMVGAGGGQISLPKLALVAGYVVVEPGCRGRTLVDDAGNYYGTAPAAIVDLKAAVRYVRHNKGRIPGDTDKIVSTGVSAGGALSALLGASGDSDLYDSYLTELGAADASDAIFATGAWCPITDLEHADMMYEWAFHAIEYSGKSVDAETSAYYRSAYEAYQKSLAFEADDFGKVTGATMDDYILTTFLRPSATAYLKGLSAAKRAAYLKTNDFITWSGGAATFSWDDFVQHIGSRKKDCPSFDIFDLSGGENNEFGLDKTQARHFTLYSARHTDASAELAADIPTKLMLMNPMYHLQQKNAGRAKHWWLRVGTIDTDTSPSVITNLHLATAALGDTSDLAMYWDEGHGSNTDPGEFMQWIAGLTGYTTAV